MSTPTQNEPSTSKSSTTSFVVTQNNIRFDKQYQNVSTGLSITHFRNQFGICDKVIPVEEYDYIYNLNEFPNIDGNCFANVHVAATNETPYEHLSPWVWELAELPFRCGTRTFTVCNQYFLFGSIRESKCFVCCYQCLYNVEHILFSNKSYVFVNHHHIHTTYHVHCMYCGKMCEEQFCPTRNIVTMKVIHPVCHINI